MTRVGQAALVERAGRPRLCRRNQWRGLGGWRQWKGLGVMAAGGEAAIRSSSEFQQSHAEQYRLPHQFD
jgi:hypothetical protein